MRYRSPILMLLTLLLLLTNHALVAQDEAKDSTVAQSSIVSGEISLSGAVTRSTVDSEKLTAGFTLDREVGANAGGLRHHISTLDLAASYESKKKEGSSATIIRSYTGWLQHLVYVKGDQWFVSGNARFLHNNSLGVYLQQRYSLLGGYVSRKGGYALELNAGPAFVGQNFLGAQQSTGFPAAELQESIVLPLRFIVKDATLSEKIRAVLPLDSDDPWIGEGNVELIVPISSAVSFNITAFDYYISNPPAGSDKHFLNTSFGFTISIGG